jgi:hypothetical protein
MLLKDAGILHRHLKAAELHNLSAELLMNIEERCALQLRHGAKRPFESYL